MKKELTLSEVKEMYSQEKCFETEKGFIINDRGKYNSGLTFIVDKQFNLDKKGKPMDPARFYEDKEITDNMNVDFDGSKIKFAFGDFWTNQKGTKCFRPKDPAEAKDMLLEVHWGGPFDRHRGLFTYDARHMEGVEFFQKSSSNGGGMGCDYYIVPVGFQNIIHDNEIDGNTKNNVNMQELYRTNAKPIKEKFSKLYKDEIQEADSYLKESIENRAAIMPKLQALNEDIKPFHTQKYSNYYISLVKCMEYDFEFKGHRYPYSEESLNEVKKDMESTKKWVLESEEQAHQKELCINEYKPRFEALKDTLESIGISIEVNTENMSVTIDEISNMPESSSSWMQHRSSEYKTFPLSKEGLEELNQHIYEKKEIIAEQEQVQANTERIQQILKDEKLPEELWGLFEGSEDLDSVIRNECKAINNAWKIEKDEMDMHELLTCGLDRRIGAIERVLEEAGGGHAKMHLSSQSLSRALARYMTEEREQEIEIGNDKKEFDWEDIEGMAAEPGKETDQDITGPDMEQKKDSYIH